MHGIKLSAFSMQDLIDKRICKTWIILILGFNMEVDSS